MIDAVNSHRHGVRTRLRNGEFWRCFNPLSSRGYSRCSCVWWHASVSAAGAGGAFAPFVGEPPLELDQLPLGSQCRCARCSQLGLRHHQSCKPLEAQDKHLQTNHKLEERLSNIACCCPQLQEPRAPHRTFVGAFDGRAEEQAM